MRAIARSIVMAALLGTMACAPGPRDGTAMRGTDDIGTTALPQGLGLGVRYPGDEYLYEHPAVIFTDDVESASGETVRRGFAAREDADWNTRWDQTWGTVRIAREATHVHAGQQAFEFHTERPAGLGLSKFFEPGLDRVFFRYYIKYDVASAGAHHVGGAMAARAPGAPPAMPGIVPDGVTNFDVLLDHWAFDPRVPAPGHLVAYVYHMDQQHQWGEQFYPSGRTLPEINGRRGLFGPSFIRRPDFVPLLGRWYCYEFMVQANRPGMRDGRVAFWVNGQLAADFPNLRFRTVPSLRINRVAIGLYESRGDGRRRRVWIDDVVVATRYIGPQVPRVR